MDVPGCDLLARQIQDLPTQFDHVAAPCTYIEEQSRQPHRPVGAMPPRERLDAHQCTVGQRVDGLEVGTNLPLSERHPELLGHGDMPYCLVSQSTVERSPSGGGIVLGGEHGGVGPVEQVLGFHEAGFRRGIGHPDAQIGRAHV